MSSLSELLSRPCYTDPCIYHFIMPASAVRVMYTYLTLEYNDPVKAVAAARSYLREMADSAKRNSYEFPNRYADMWPLFPELVERVYLVHGIFSTIKWLHQYADYLGRNSINVHSLFYAHTHNSLVELGRVSDTSKIYATVRILTPLCSAIRYIGRPRDTGNIPWEDIWLISGNQYNAHIHNHLAVVEVAAKVAGCSYPHATLGEFMP